MTDKFEQMSVFEQLKTGLQESIAHAKGELTLRTTTLPLPPPAISATQVRALRTKMRMSQAMFAANLNVSTKTVQSWEQGVREPNGAALRLIQVLQQNPESVTATGTNSQSQNGSRSPGRFVKQNKPRQRKKGRRPARKVVYST